MFRYLLRLLAAISFYIWFSSISSISLCQQFYKVTDLGTLGGIQSSASGISNAGQVVGSSLLSNNSTTHAFLWENNEMTDLGTLGGIHSYGYGTNNSRQVVGYSLLSNNTTRRAFLWENGAMTDLGTLGWTSSQAYGINSSGQVVGVAEDLSGYAHAFLWEDSVMADLGTLGGGYSEARAINSSGQVVGLAEPLGLPYHAFLWENGVMTDLGTLGGVISIAQAINSSGQVVGDSYNSADERHAFLWDGVMTDLGTLGGSNSYAIAINDSGQVVGMSEGPGFNQHAFLWENGVMIDLNSIIDSSSGWILYLAYSINDNGEIVGTGFHNGQLHAFLLKPVRYPVLIVPGIAGTYAADVNSDLEWLVTRGISPDKIQVDPLAGVYDSLIKTLENVGYEKDKDLFVVNYDWRVVPAPLDNNFDGYIDGITGTSITDDEFKYGVDYLGWYIKRACDRWRADYNEELDSIDIISHSTGGLVTRSYIQSSAYGGVYDAANNYRLAKIRNFIMIGVPNRGASKAWNPLHDNWISDVAYRFVLSKIINRAYQKLRRGYIITGPDYYITWGSILDSLGNPNKELFIKKYVPTISGLLATFDFIDFGNGLTNVNNDPLERNSLILDLNNGYDLYPSADPNHFLDSTSVKVLYGISNETLDYVEQRDDPEFNAFQSFTDWTRSSVLGGTTWYKDLASGQNTGDGTVPTVSAVGQFLNDNRAAKFPFTVSNHTGMVSTLEVQSNILNILNVNYDQENIAIGSSENVSNILHIISDPIELFVTDGVGRRLGYSNSTGKVTEIPNSSWFGNTEGMGYVFGSVVEPINLQLTGLGEDYYVMVSVEDSGNGGGIMVEGFLALGEVANYQITLNPLSVDQIKTLTPENFELAQNYPNPFNPITAIQYSIPQRSNVTLKVYDILGNEVTTLVNEEKERGVYTINFNASQLASGIYLYRLQAGAFVETKKMILIK